MQIQEWAAPEEPGAQGALPRRAPVSRRLQLRTNGYKRCAVTGECSDKIFMSEKAVVHGPEWDRK